MPPAAGAAAGELTDEDRRAAAAYAKAAVDGHAHGAHRWGADPLEGPRGRVVRREYGTPRPAPSTAGSAGTSGTRLVGRGGPSALQPMLASPGVRTDLADQSRWRFEAKWDGIRALALVSAAGVRLIGRSGRDLSAGYPELRELGDQLGGHEAVLDGEIVALEPGPDGAPRTSFPLLQRRMNLVNKAAIEAIMTVVPVRYFAFDVLELDGVSLLNKSFDDRRRLLEALSLNGIAEVPALLGGDLDGNLELARERDWEGIVAKRSDSDYRPGQRVGSWLKFKIQRHQEVVVIGWKPGTGRRTGGIGSLAMAVPDSDGTLRYAGRVGTGFSDRLLDELHERLRPLVINDCPVDGVPPAERRGMVWLRPEVVAEVGYSEWTPDHHLRTPVWRGLRTDRTAADTRREDPPVS